MNIILQYENDNERNQILSNLKILDAESKANLDDVEAALIQRVSDVAVSLFIQGDVDAAIEQAKILANSAFKVTTEVLQPVQSS